MRLSLIPFGVLIGVFVFTSAVWGMWSIYFDKEMWMFGIPFGLGFWMGFMLGVPIFLGWPEGKS